MERDLIQQKVDQLYGRLERVRCDQAMTGNPRLYGLFGIRRRVGRLGVLDGMAEEVEGHRLRTPQDLSRLIFDRCLRGVGSPINTFQAY